ncbi:hypothetical protein SUDANB120_00504 [Streptomyces sp. enrichment culture]|uniref:hypothetical protein n=1 Tax=Streptomyces TaxID=1883 RepID=UPI0016738D3E|nr:MULTISPECIES: hypothetical protein [Streptomyces]MBD3580006.1 hypothetical protein [Streptomyces sp. KD18]GGT21025.1 hypothetical protein GCM10010286_53260 [Streptomyces toxytricini]
MSERGGLLLAALVLAAADAVAAWLAWGTGWMVLCLVLTPPAVLCAVAGLVEGGGSGNVDGGPGLGGL